MEIKNESELLNMFCDKFSQTPWINAPFFNTEYNEVWATDNHIFIGIKPDTYYTVKDGLVQETDVRDKF